MAVAARRGGDGRTRGGGLWVARRGVLRGVAVLALLLAPALLATCAPLFVSTAATAEARPRSSEAVGGRSAHKGSAPSQPARRLVAGAGLAAAILGAQPEARAEEPEITAKCELMIRVGYDKTLPLKRLVIGVYGNEAPVHARAFLQACAGKVPGKAGVQARYQLATMKSVSKNRMIGFGNFPGGNWMVTKDASTAAYATGVIGKEYQVPLAGPDTLTDETNELRHDRKGRVSMSKGGGSYNFVITPVENAPWLDARDNVVVGQVLEGFDTIEALNEVKSYERGGALNLLQGPTKETQTTKDYLQEPLTKVQIWKSAILGSGQESPQAGLGLTG